MTAPGFAGRDPPPGLNSKLLDAILRHRHFLFGVENGLSGELARLYRRALREIRTATATHIRGEAVDDLGRLNLMARGAVDRAIIQAITRAELAGGTVLTQRLSEIARREIEIQSRLVRRIVPDAVPLSIPEPDDRLIAGLLGRSTAGFTAGERWTRNARELLITARRHLAFGVALNETFAQLGERLALSIDELGVQRGTLIARTEVQRMANQASQELFRQNQDILDGVQIVETLDDRTCLICAAQDGRVVTVDDPDIPPFHPLCRGVLVPVVTQFQNLGIDDSLVPPAKRASMNGAIPATTTYPVWFRQQPERFQRRVLGRRRFDLFQRGLVDLQQMVRDGRILRVDELPGAA